MDLRQLTTFREVARQLSFTRAAARLNYVQSNVTAQIQALEEELGVPLFDRLGKQVLLTNAGRNLLEYAERLLSLAAEAHSVVSSGKTPQGTLKISSSETFCVHRLPALLRAFRSAYPEVHLIYCPYRVSELGRLVREGAIDVAFTFDEVERLEGPGNELLSYEPVWLLTAPDHPLALLETVSPADLMGADLLLTEKDCCYRTVFERILSRAGIVAGTMMEFSNQEAVKQCVMTGLGVTVMPALAAHSEVEQGRLCSLPWAGPPLALTTRLLWNEQKWRSPALDAFLAMARSMFKTANALP